MRYAIERYNNDMRTMAYQIYTSDCLYYQAQNQMLTTRFYDMIVTKKVDNRTGDEIAADVINRLNLNFEGGED